MKIQCDVCERAAAAVLCFADEAALCWSCDEKVHAANKVAGKHRRVLLLPRNPTSTSADIPACDVCKDKAGYFFCLEDRALLCRQCDATTHAAKPRGSSHQRFLITGVRVDDAIDSSSSKANGSGIQSPSGSLASTPTAAVAERLQGDPVGHDGWSWSELLDGVELDRWHGIPDPGSASS
ncbi:salt tolerance-like protein [Musa troglodytarum]|uniref:Salt tolerance-like protein n=1 Tax=Musa troglodytarum TaxID=320322 RepID=A0A9E7JUM9_9LILI|nr:salt tolerance-like protein [Musa troglodytarum]